ncbi:PREDICTED: probable LRR receptor-like serine/threonine-protein kinase At3g47570 [Theobroma cacao]|uniref:non-specific serine/threonine protein kinase n=1 Tax=Theobroma cacao TaxID=3641 RepID=A0AB32X230_THECC|nr:PREDICTED: probable LRR receptor-like serine/threonine-protein kinase At3g47570 [Theobroma cacao]
MPQFICLMGLAGLRLEVPWALIFAVSLLLCCNSQGPYLIGPEKLVVNGNDTDRQALLEFKAKIAGDQLGVMRLWNDSVHFCQWHGVTCSSRHQRVTKLELRSLKLTGIITPYIGNLSFLKVLNLSNNGFSHGVPQEIGRLHRLEELILDKNPLGGQVPSNISGCSKLKRLYIGHCQLVGEIPGVLGLLYNLKYLGLSNNSLAGSIPPSLGNLSSLEIVYLSINDLSGTIPESLGQLRNLTVLSVPMNALSGIVPSSIFNLSNIRTLDIGSNQFQGSLPTDLGITIPYVETLYVSRNQFSGPFPLSISNASNLINLEFSFNKLVGKLPSFEKLDKLEWFTLTDNLLGSGEVNDLDFVCSLMNATSLVALEINYNNFGGVIRTCISNLSTNLIFFLLDGNEISGTFPVGIGNLINLEMLLAGSNQLSGSIPSTIQRLQKVQWLDLSNNSFSGSIPSSLGNLTMLLQLKLSQNNLKGTIPSSLSKCENLVLLDLSNNNLTGSIPPEVLGLSSLSLNLDLSSNYLTGVLPNEVGNLKNLGQLSVSQNRLSGVLPSSLGVCVRLEKLMVSENFFHGTIPSSFSSLRGLTVLDISHNNLSGEIPEFFANFTLQYLNLSYNDFEGMVPTGGVFNNASATSIEGNNKLCGGTPEFHLHGCNLKRSRRKSSSRLKLIIAIVFGLLGVTLVLLFLLVFWFRKRRKQPASTSPENSLLRLSYQSILKATDGFSSANLIGVGAYGSVYKGILQENEIVVAIKVLNLLNHKASRSFMAECEALRKIRHRNLVKVLTACSGVDYHGNDFKALVYEFMSNGSLEDWLHSSIEIEADSKKSLNLYQRLNVAIDVACALDYLHHHCDQTSIVHCDLKPSNILLDDKMTGHVGDFGLVKFISEDTQNYSASQSSTLGLRGTIGYAPPEYGLGSEVSTYGDVYSYGILLLEIFTGKRPTDEMFKDGLNLHNLVRTALPERAVEMTDPILLQERVTGETVANTSDCNESSQSNKILLQCLNSIYEVELTCSAELPTVRMNMSEVVAELCLIRNKLFPTKQRPERHIQSNHKVF